MQYTYPVGCNLMLQQVAVWAPLKWAVKLFYSREEESVVSGRL